MTYLARTPIFRTMQKVVKQLRRETQPHTMTRRQFLTRTLHATAIAAMPLGLGRCAPRRTLPTDAKVSIVGGGLAGLYCAYLLQKVGVRASLFEASHRLGGRMITARNGMGPGSTTEIGGEFFDSGHEEVLGLVQEFGLELIDVNSNDEKGFEEVFYFEGSARTERQILTAFEPLAARIRADLSTLSEDVTYRVHNAAALRIDRMSIAEYLDTIGARGWIRKLLEVAYVTEYGLEADRQSALNLLYLIGIEEGAEGFKVFGESDERFKIRGGNDLLISSLKNNLTQPIEVGHRLLAVRQERGQYFLSFELPGGSIKETKADIVVLTVPFSVLGEVELPETVSFQKRNAIRTLGYGTNSKLVLGFDRPLWRTRHLAGDFFSDTEAQSGWDSTRAQGVEAASITTYFGGALGKRLTSQSADEYRRKVLPLLNQMFHGVTAHSNANQLVAAWPSEPFVKGSYAAYGPGQWTSVRGIEAEAEGNLLFAGEHCSLDFQGFMNGAAESGRRAALETLSRIGRESVLWT